MPLWSDNVGQSDTEESVLNSSRENGCFSFVVVERQWCRCETRTDGQRSVVGALVMRPVQLAVSKVVEDWLKVVVLVCRDQVVSGKT